MPSADGEIDADVAMAIELARLCEVYHTLPKAGGLLDQDSYYVWLLKLVMSADGEKAELDSKRRKESPPTKGSGSGRVTTSRHR